MITITLNKYQKLIIERLKALKDGKKFLPINRCPGKRYIHIRQNKAIKQLKKLQGPNLEIGKIIFNDEQLTKIGNINDANMSHTCNTQKLCPL